eukprot:COSAG02_NODE_4427_length_5372_cov_4.047791_6_plen_232_part_00
MFEQAFLQRKAAVAVMIERQRASAAGKAGGQVTRDEALSFGVAAAASSAAAASAPTKFFDVFQATVVFDESGAIIARSQNDDLCCWFITAQWRCGLKRCLLGPYFREEVTDVISSLKDSQRARYPVVVAAGASPMFAELPMVSRPWGAEQAADAVHGVLQKKIWADKKVLDLFVSGGQEDPQEMDEYIKYIGVYFTTRKGTEDYACKASLTSLTSLTPVPYVCSLRLSHVL